MTDPLVDAAFDALAYRLSKVRTTWLENREQVLAQFAAARRGGISPAEEREIGLIKRELASRSAALHLKSLQHSNQHKDS